MCDEIKTYTAGNFIVKEDSDKILEPACLTKDELFKYLGWKKNTMIADLKLKWFYGWHISNLKIYDKPRELRDFGITRPPQSWCYVEEQLFKLHAFA